MKIIDFLHVQVIVLVVLLCCGIPVNAKRAKRQALGRRCYTPDSRIGACVILPECVGLLKSYEQYGRTTEVERYLTSALYSCGRQVQSGEPVVCCESHFRAATNTSTTTTSRPVTFQPGTVPPFVAPTIITTPPMDRTTRTIHSNCRGEDGLPGRCINLRDCRTFFERLQNKPDDNDFVEFLRRSNAICQRPTPIVCCPTGSRGSYTLPTPEEGCGYAKAAPRGKVGVYESRLGAWPWITLLGYRESNGEISWKCGGTLITNRHIITAANCINSQLAVVRLGEHDLSNATETRHVDIAVMKAQKHPNYDSRDRHSDIAIVYLERDVEFTELIKPICLPLTAERRSKDYTGYHPNLAGWGRTQEGGGTASIIQENDLPITSNQQCMQRYRDTNRLISDKQFDDKVLCVGFLHGTRDDLCHADSGGALNLPERINERKFIDLLMGVASYGVGCTQTGIPATYCNVPAFIDWIQEKVAEPL